MTRTLETILSKQSAAHPVRYSVLFVLLTLWMIPVVTDCCNVRAQTAITVPYFLGFEANETAEMANWVINPGAQASSCGDAWTVGTAIKNGGHQSLYVSNDNGVTAAFGYTSNVQYVYRDFTIARGVYEISFDWCCLGTNNATMYAGIAPAANLTLNANSSSAQIPNNVMSWCSTLGAMNGTSLWRNASLRLNSNGSTTYRLFFVWASSNRDSTLANPLGGCIDNIQICSANCAKPTNLTASATCDTVTVGWDGTSEKYSLEYRKRGQNNWVVVSSNLQTESTIIEGLDEGLYDLRVRGICNLVDTSAYCYLNSFALFCPFNHCLNYVDFTDTVNVVCTYGTFQNPDLMTGVVDYGADSKYSRHTVNWDPDVYDPRTCNQLPTIPTGELASVRLGNWNVGAEAESVSFRYVADITNSAILLMKYAIVMEDPNHGESAQPHFTLEILDENDNLISPTCGYADFYANVNRNDPGWHICSSAPGASSPVTWKEWTTIGLNLQEAGVNDGDVLRIRLTTKDCSASGHFGYAYFTIGCAAARLIGKSCGNESSLTVSAPEGFNYEWFNKYDSLVSTDISLSVDPSDTTTYRCHLMYKENNDCDFNLYTAVMPRFPIPAFHYSYDPADCQNRVRFYNDSHIMTIFDGDTTYHTGEGLESYTWRFGTGDEASEVNPVYYYPEAGGTYNVTLFGSISDGACIEDTTITITLPKIGDTNEVIDTTICEGSYVVFGKYYAGETGDYLDENKSTAGCDSIVTLRLTVSPVTNAYLGDTTVCAEEPLVVDNQPYRFHESGVYYRFYKNVHGCDSTVWMNVTMLDSIIPTAVMKDIEGDEEYSGSFTIGGTGYDYYMINGERNGRLDSLNGGPFVLDFYNDFGCVVSREFEMTYPCRNLIAQRWDDVLFMMNEVGQQATNPHVEPYTFVQYQWYKNGAPLLGETRSYLYVPDGLDPQDSYQVFFVTADGISDNTCPYNPVAYTPEPAPVGARLVMEDGRLLILTEEAVYNILGDLL